MVEAFHQAKSDWVTGGLEHDWNRGPGVFGSQRPRGRGRGDDGDLPVNEIRREARQTFVMTLGPAILNSDILAVGVTSFLQSCTERDLKERARIAPTKVKETDHRLGRLLRARRQRTKCRSA